MQLKKIFGLGLMYLNKRQEVQEFISRSNLVDTAVVLVASKKFWEGLNDADKAGAQKAAGDKEVIGKFGTAGVKVDAIPPVELTKCAPQIGEAFIKEFHAEIDKVRGRGLPASRHFGRLPPDAFRRDVGRRPPWSAPGQPPFFMVFGRT